MDQHINIFFIYTMIKKCICIDKYILLCIITTLFSCNYQIPTSFENEFRGQNDDDCFQRHDKWVIESIKNKIELKYGVTYLFFPKSQKDKIFNNYIQAYIGRNNAERQLLKIRNKPMSLYGKIIDQFGEPVEDAEITLSVLRETMVGRKFKFKRETKKTYKLFTNINGEFVLKDVIGWRVDLLNVCHVGYTYNPDWQASKSFFPITHPSQLKAPYFFRQNAKFPVVIVLDKYNTDLNLTE